MIDALGPYLLILVYRFSTAGGITIQEMSSFESCQAAITQIEPIRNVSGYCIAKELK